MALSRARRRALIGLSDQGLYSLGNFALTVLVAGSVSSSEFGAYSLIMATYLIILNVMRGLTSETFVVRFSDTSWRRWRHSAKAAAGASTVLGLFFGVILAGVGLVTSGTFQATALTLAPFLPALMLQDYLRFAALALGRPGAALVNDFAVSVVQFGASAWLIHTGHASVPTLIAAWGAGSAVGAVVAMAMLQLPPYVHRWLRWLRRNRDLASRYAVDDLVQQGSQQVVTYIVAAVAGLSSTGALRGAQTVFGPPSVVNVGVMSALTPELVRLLNRSPRRMRRAANLVGTVLGCFGLAWGAVAIFLPNRLGVVLFGDTWPLTHPLLVYLCVAQMATSYRVGFMSGLRALGAANRTLRARTFITAVALALTTLGAVIDGARGVAIALAVSGPIQALIWRWQFNIAFDEHVAAERSRPRSKSVQKGERRTVS